MAQPIVDPGLQDPKKVVGKDAVIFGELLGWGARLAIGTCSQSRLVCCSVLIHTLLLPEIYNDRRQNWIADEITDRVRRLDDAMARFVFRDTCEHHSVLLLSQLLLTCDLSVSMTARSRASIYPLL